MPCDIGHRRLQVPRVHLIVGMLFRNHPFSDDDIALIEDPLVLTKLDGTFRLQGGRQYRCTTFTTPPQLR
jgi:hypothetical protein